MKVIICDRCKEKIEENKKIGKVSATLWYRGVPKSGNPYDKWDLCEDCMKKIVMLIDGTIDVQLEPEGPAGGSECRCRGTV